MKKVLTIAGSDCSGGAGIQADIKTITTHKMYAMSVITAIVAENTTGVYDLQEVCPASVAQQLDCVFQDIRPDAVKIGMVVNIEIIEIIAQKLLQYQAPHIVLDPVMVAASGGRLFIDSATQTLIERLFPLAQVITPNIPEAEALTGFRPITEPQQMRYAAELLAPKVGGGGVIIKGGHLSQSADDLLWVDGQAIWYPSPRVDNPNNHGSGCTFSSAIACNLAAGYTLQAAVRNAKAYITDAMRAQLNLGSGSGPLNHCCRL